MANKQSTFEAMHLKFEKVPGEDFKKFIQQAKANLDAIGSSIPNTKR